MATPDPNQLAQVQEHVPLLVWVAGAAWTAVAGVITYAAMAVRIGAWKSTLITREEADGKYMDKLRCGEHHALIERELAAIKQQNACLAKAVTSIQTNIAVMATQMASEHPSGMSSGMGSSANWGRRSTDSAAGRFLPDADETGGD